MIVLLSVLALPSQLYAGLGENWWLKSSLADSTGKPQIHSSGQYSYNRMQGVLSGNMQSGNIMFVLRKGLFTNHTDAGVDIMKLNLKSLNNIKYETTSYYFTDYLDVYICRFFFGQLGYIWERDDALLLDNRYTGYAGLGTNYSAGSKLILKSLAAIGRINQEYIISVDNMDMFDKPYSAFYFTNNCTYSITPDLTLSGRIYYFTNLEDKYRYRYGCNIDLKVGLNKFFSLVIGYNYRYDKELSLLGLIPDNSQQNIGIQVSF